LNEVSININGEDYYIKQFQGRKSFMIKTKLLNVVGKGALALKEVDDPLTLIVSLVSAVFENLKPEESLALVEELLSETYKGNMKLNFDKEFSGNMSGVYKLAFEVVKLNYSDLFQMLGIDVTN
jgi:hypothetical protein